MIIAKPSLPRHKRLLMPNKIRLSGQRRRQNAVLHQLLAALAPHLRPRLVPAVKHPWDKAVHQDSVGRHHRLTPGFRLGPTPLPAVPRRIKTGAEHGRHAMPPRRDPRLLPHLRQAVGPGKGAAPWPHLLKRRKK